MTSLFCNLIEDVHDVFHLHFQVAVDMAYLFALSILFDGNHKVQVIKAPLFSNEHLGTVIQYEFSYDNRPPFSRYPSAE